MPWSTSESPNQPPSARRRGSARARRRPARARAAGRRPRSGRPCRGTACARSRARRGRRRSCSPGTAIAAISSVSWNACTAAGEVIASQNGAEAGLERAAEDHPDRRDEQQRRGSRARRSAARSATRCRRRALRAHACGRASRPSGGCRRSRAGRRTRRRAGRTETAAAPLDVVALDLAEDVDGRDLGVEREVARDQHDRAELADRARERERDAGEDRRQRGSGRRCAGRSAVGRAPRQAAASSISRSSSSSTGCTVRTTNGSVTKSSASTIAARV